MPPLCSGLARRPLKAVARVRIPSGVRSRNSPILSPGSGFFAFPWSVVEEVALRPRNPGTPPLPSSRCRNRHVRCTSAAYILPPEAFNDVIEAESLRHLRASDYVVLGRRTYELLYEAWGGIKQGAHFTQLEQQAGEDIEVYGSSTFVQALMKHDLVDEYRIAIHPVVLGRGTTLFPQGGISASLQLASARTLDIGVVNLTYCPLSRPDRARRHGSWQASALALGTAATRLTAGRAALLHLATAIPILPTVLRESRGQRAYGLIPGRNWSGRDLGKTCSFSTRRCSIAVFIFWLTEENRRVDHRACSTREDRRHTATPHGADRGNG